MEKETRRQEPEEYMRTAEVARLLHVSPKTVSRWAKEGKIPCVRTLGGHRRFSGRVIRELIEKLAGEAGEMTFSGARRP